jgi:pimeloyl-ACP methyl ester carboxylesterase
VAQLMFYEDLKDVVLVGTSYGGMVSCRAAELMRQRISRLVFVDALTLFDGEKVADILPNSTSVADGVTLRPSPEDVANRLFADLDPKTRAWALERRRPNRTGLTNRASALSACPLIRIRFSTRSQHAKLGREWPRRFARLFTSTWTLSMRPSSSAITPTSGGSQWPWATERAAEWWPLPPTRLASSVSDLRCHL